MGLGKGLGLDDGGVRCGWAWLVLSGSCLVFTDTRILEFYECIEHILDICG